MGALGWEAFAATVVLKGTFLLLVTWAAARLLRRSSAATRHLAWTTGVIGLLAMPLLATLAPWRLPLLPPRETPAIETTPRVTSGIDAQAMVEAADAARQQVPFPGSTPAPAPAISDPAQPASGLPGRTPLLLALVAAWVLGAATVAVRLVAGSLRLARSTRRARAAAGPGWDAVIERAARGLSLERPVPVLLSADVAMPLVAGALRPRVLLPLEAEAWSEERRRAVVSHELAHIRRGDIVPHLAAWAACALWWFHPLAWAAARRLRAESERACDDLVLGLGTRASDYAQDLLQIVISMRGRRVPATVLPLAQRTEFEGRVLAILEPQVTRGGISRARGAAVVAAIALLAVPLAVVVPARAGVVTRQTQITPPPGVSAADRLVDGGFDPAPENAKPTANPGLDIEALYRFDFDSDGTVDLRIDEESVARIASAAAALVSRNGGGSSASASESATATTTSDTGHVSVAVIAGLSRALGDADALTREAAATALGHVGDPRAVAALSRALRQDADARVRRAAAWALGEIESSAGVPALAAALREDRDVTVRRTAAWALGEIESADAVPALSAALRDADLEIRRTAVWALGEIESADAVPALAGVLRDPDVEMRRKAAWALGEIESSRAVEPLSAALRDADLEVRKTAAWALGEIESPAAIPALSAALRDADREVRKAAAWALAEIDTPAAYDSLIPLLESDDAELRRLAVEAIAKQ